MKVELKDGDGNNFDVGLEYFESDNSEESDLLFWIENSTECITLKVDKKIMDQLTEATKFMKGNVRV